MHDSLSTYLKRALTVALIVGPMLALVSVDVEARGGGRGGGGGRQVAHGGGGGGVRTPRANVGGGGRDFNRGDVNRRDVNVQSECQR